MTINLLRRNFPWIVTEKDEIPAFDEQALNKYVNTSFDPHLGWVRQPGTSGVEKGKNGQITFHIDEMGSRDYSFDGSPPVVAAFGDSYVFCRQVEDDETWEAQLSHKTGSGVLNFGVGNYGVDQALLRYEATTLPGTVKVAILGFVPETICRVQSCWKHYLEFGNTFAFKPRFLLDSKDELVLQNNPIRSLEDFYELKENLPEIQKTDAFYDKKFRSRQFRFPYILSYFRNPLKQSRLIYAILVRAASRLLGLSTPALENMPFSVVMKDNLRQAHSLYNDERSTKLLSAILLRFRDLAKSRGHVPLIVLMPQLFDLRLNDTGVAPYSNFYSGLASRMPVIDLSNKFMDMEYEKLYINDIYGGHLSTEGNSLVSEEILSWMKSVDLPAV